MAGLTEKFQRTAKREFSQGELDGMVHEAVSKDSEMLLRLVLESGGSPEGKADGRTMRPLGTAIQKGGTGVARALLEYGADPDIPLQADGSTALMLCVIHYRHDIIDALLAHKADPDLKRTTGDTALVNAANSGDDVSFEKLLNAGANPAIPGREGLTPYQIAAKDLADGGLTDAGEAAMRRIIALLDARNNVQPAPKNAPKI